MYNNLEKGQEKNMSILMVILRGGKRIGGYDIRIGLPRDRSLDDVQSDPRLRQRQVVILKLLWVDFSRWLMKVKVSRRVRFYVEFFCLKD